MRIAYEYIDYLMEPIVAIGEDEIAALDMTKQVEHFYSMGSCDPIESSGLGWKYNVREIEDPPEWLIRGLMKHYDGSEYTREDCEKFAVLILCKESRNPLAKDLLTLHYKRGKFAESLKQFYAERGYLTQKQRAALNYDFRKRHYEYY